MNLHKIFSFLIKRGSYLVMFVSLVVYTRIQHLAVRQPDPATGHVYRVVSPKSRRIDRHIMYLTSTERTLFHGSLILMAVGVVGIFGHLIMIRNRNTTTSPD